MDDRSGDLVERASRGDGPAIEALLERYAPGLHGFVRLRMGAVLAARESTSDIVQSTCREVLAHAERFRHDGEAGFKRWLYRTALRKIANRDEYYRAQKREAGRELPPASLSQSEAVGLLAGYASLCTPSREAAGREEVLRIERAFAALPDDYREVVLLSRIAGLPRAEVAREMGRSEGSVRMLLARALAALSEELERGAESGPPA
jgi:RNA polymerase sigma-70 factor (ECF subfamily)